MVNPAAGGLATKNDSPTARSAHGYFGGRPRRAGCGGGTPVSIFVLIYWCMDFFFYFVNYILNIIFRRKSLLVSGVVKFSKKCLV